MPVGTIQLLDYHKRDIYPTNQQLLSSPLGLVWDLNLAVEKGASFASILSTLDNGKISKGEGEHPTP